MAWLIDAVGSVENRHPTEWHRVVLCDQSWRRRRRRRYLCSPTSGAALTAGMEHRILRIDQGELQGTPGVGNLDCVAVGPATAPRTWMATKWSATPTSCCCSPIGAEALLTSMAMVWLASATSSPCSPYLVLAILIREPTGLSNHAHATETFSPAPAGLFLWHPWPTGHPPAANHTRPWPKGSWVEARCDAARDDPSPDEGSQDAKHANAWGRPIAWLWMKCPVVHRRGRPGHPKSARQRLRSGARGFGGGDRSKSGRPTWHASAPRQPVAKRYGPAARPDQGRPNERQPVPLHAMEDQLGPKGCLAWDPPTPGNPFPPDAR